MNNPLFRYTKVEASEEETSVVSSNKPHDSNSLANITSSKKKINATAKHNSEAKTFAFEKAKSLNKASVGKNTFRASRNVFEGQYSIDLDCHYQIQAMSMIIACIGCPCNNRSVKWREASIESAHG